MDKYKVAIVVPAYNEERTIGEVVKSISNYGDVILVNDASTDATKEIALKMNVILINNKINLGYDKALNMGFSEADKRNYNAVITFDADGQHSPDSLKMYIECLENGVDLVLGVRKKTGRVAEWIFMLYTHKKFKWQDPLCGMKGYSMSLYRGQGYFDSYGSIGTELSHYGLKNNYSFKQLNIPIKNRKDTPRFSSTIKANFYILRALAKMIISK